MIANRCSSRIVLALLSLCLLSIYDVTHAQSDGDRRLYDSDELFNQLSGAYRSKLERMFGKKHSNATGKSEDVTQSSAPVLVPNHGSLSALANTLINNAAADLTAQDTQSETALVLGSGSVVIGGYNDSGSYTGSNNHFTGWSRSIDGGTNWTDGGTLPLDAAVGDAGDPVLARSAATGTIFMSTLGFTLSNTLQIFRSTDNGATWGTPISGSPGQPSGNQDKEWIAVDNFAGTGNGYVYMFWRNFGTPSGMNFSRSTNDGVTWTVLHGPLSGVTGGQGAYVVVGPDHAVYCFWLNGTSISVRKSTDLGVTFGAAVTVTTLLTTGTNGDLGLGFRSNAFPHAGVNAISGNLFVVYNDNPAGADRGDIYFRQSTNGGTTWTAQVRVNDDGGTNDNWEPAIAVTPDGTALCVTWYDRRSDPANSLIERWGTIATISGATVTFGPNFRISPPFSAVYGVDPVINTVYMGDYDQMDADNSFFHTVWGDNRDQSVAVPLRKNANVRFAKIPKAGPGPILDYVSTAISGGNGNGGVDINECNNLTITLRNNGSSTATGVSATLNQTGGNPEVYVESPIQPFSNIAAGATGTNSVSFRLSTTSAFACGTPITLTLTITYTGGSDVVTFTIPTNGSAGTPVQFNYTVVTAITDLATTNIPIAVSGFSGVVADVNVSFYLTHTWDEDLDIFLIGPDATSVELTTDNGTSGDNYGSLCSSQSTRTTFDDAAATAITVGTPPFVGTFRPEGLLSAFNGKTGAAVNGSWTLRIIDDTGQDAGTFNCVTVFISPVGACTPGPGECSALPIQLASFSGMFLMRNTVQLDWLTISEINNYGFEVERSQTLSGAYQTLGFVPGHGTTNEPHQYRFVDTTPGTTSIYYRLKQIDLDGTIHYIDPIRVSIPTSVRESEMPSVFSLSQNYPNPFNPSTVIRYGLPAASDVKLEVFNIMGQRVAVLANRKQEAGFHEAIFDGQNFSSGLYFYTIQAGLFRESRRLLLLK